MTGAKPPNPVVRTVVDWKASRIDDPVARLRFLRHTVGDQAPWGPSEVKPKPWWRRKRLQIAAGLVLVIVPASQLTDAGRVWRRPPAAALAKAGEAKPDVWMVQQTKEFETYSNGLRVERRFETSNEPRSFEVFQRGEEEVSTPQPRVEPAGIVYHTSESMQDPFEEKNIKRLVFIGESLLGYVRDSKSYNYVVDRFGRVWRVVRDSDAAWHAGPSVWADSKNTYISLNHAFLGVALESQTRDEEKRPREHMMATPAQIHSLRVLTDMLRARYKIDAADCVTHAQVSVNPSNFMIGYHTDWAAHFPYTEIGLADNYATPNPALVQFGFNYDPDLMKVTGERYWKGLVLGDEQLRQDASAHGQGVAAYRKQLHEKFRQLVKSLKERMEDSKEKQG